MTALLAMTLIASLAGGTWPQKIAAQTRPSDSSVEKLDYAMIGKIRDESLSRSQAMDHVSWLSDVYGPRLTGSPAIKQASEWARKKFAEWGLANIHEEEFPFGKGWSLVRFSANMIEPQVQPLIGYPHSWTASTPGAVTAEVVYAPIQSVADLEKYRGKLRGKIVLTQAVREVKMLDGPVVLRMTEEDIREAKSTPIPAPRGQRGGGAGGAGGGGRGGGAGRAGGADDAAGAADEQGQRGGGAGGQNLQARMREFLLAEGAAATFDRGSDNFMSAGGSDLSWRTQRTDGGTVFPSGSGPRDQNAGKVVPGATLAVEHYNRMVRILEKGVPVKVELDLQTKFYDETGMNGFNVVAEIPGTDLASEVVMIGAHFDSVAASTGATDNATGSAAMMEVMRILKAVGAKPRRTIRIALWGGEEQGLMGSRAYVRQHFADRANMQLKPAHEKLSAYFNIDNGTGRIRGIWMQSNLAVKRIFEQWIEPLESLGVNILGPRSVSSTDHVAFDEVGLPAFQFIQERLEYNSRTHHSNMDFVDRVQRDDMVQMATVAAIFAYNAAMRDEKLPRKALPPPTRGGR
jgi:hypothetical protein